MIPAAYLRHASALLGRRYALLDGENKGHVGVVVRVVILPQRVEYTLQLPAGLVQTYDRRRLRRL